MADSATATTLTKCLSCGHEAPSGSGEWESVDLPSLGSVNRCPECGSTDTTSIRES